MGGGGGKHGTHIKHLNQQQHRLSSSSSGIDICSHLVMGDGVEANKYKHHKNYNGKHRQPEVTTTNIQVGIAAVILERQDNNSDCLSSLTFRNTV